MVFNIGNIIKSRRQQLGITQEQAAEGICTRETISLIENNKISPNLFILDKLMDKLALDTAGLFGIPGSQQDIYSLAKQSEIFLQMYHAEKNPTEGGRNLRQMLRALKSDDLLDESYKQFLLDFGYTHLYIYSTADRNLDRAERRAFRLLRRHRNGFNLADLSKYYMTSTELNIINRLSYLYRLRGEPQTAIDILQTSRTFQEQSTLNRDLRGFRPIYISTIMHLTDAMLLAGLFDDALALADEYFPKLLEHDSLKLTIKLMYVRCLAFLNLGRQAEGEQLLGEISTLCGAVDNLFVQLDPQRPDVSEWLAYIWERFGISGGG